VKATKHAVTVKTQAAQTTEAPVTEPSSTPPADQTTPPADEVQPPADPGQGHGGHGTQQRHVNDGTVVPSPTS